MLWLLEELGLTYEVTRYARDPRTMFAPQALRRVHPLGKSPVITDGEVCVAESGAIVDYLLETHGQGRLVPMPGTGAHRQWRYWLHFAEGSAMPPLLMSLVFQRVVQAPMPFFARPIARAIAGKVQQSYLKPNLDAQLEFMNAELVRGGGWFAGGEFSAADIMMSFPVEIAAERIGLGPGHEALQDYLTRIHARPAYTRALARGDGAA